MFRLVGTSVVLGVALAVLGTAAYAAAVPPDASEYQWAQGQPAGVASLPDANERAAQPTVVVMTDANERTATPVAAEAAASTDLGWSRVTLAALVIGGLVIAVVVLAIMLAGRPRGHPPLAHR